MSESQRSGASEGFSAADNPGLSSEDAAELEELRREAAVLREQLENAVGPQSGLRTARDVHQLEARIDSLAARNAKLMDTLKEARQQLLALREEVDRLGQPPSGYGVLLSVQDDDTVDVFTSGRKMRLTCSPNIDVKVLKKGQTVRLNEALTVVEAGTYEAVGEISTLREILSDGHRALVVGHADEERIVWLAEPLVAIEDMPSQVDDGVDDDLRPRKLRPGDSLLVDTKAGYAFERIPKAEVEDLVLEEVPDVAYEDIGGLTRQIEQIRDAVELPFLHKELYREYSLRPPKGVLLYGPPGCGKTLIAKAVANSLAKKVSAREGLEAGRSFFLNIKGPELLNKYVGETERHIRLVFQRAREKASEGMPVIVFFDEMDSVFRTRGSGVSSDVETTIVPQFLSELDGVESLDNVMVIGASNRVDMIDPAVLRPGRLDVKIRVGRPKANQAIAIVDHYLTDDLPLEDGVDAHALSAVLVHDIYGASERRHLCDVQEENGQWHALFLADVVSGAMLKNIVDRAKTRAVKESIETGLDVALTVPLLAAAVEDEYRETRDSMADVDPEQWSRINGMDPIRRIRTAE